jgi:hypothetical protein
MASQYTFKDAKGREYTNFYCKECDLTVAIDGEVSNFRSSPKFVIMRGESVFGEQLIIQGLIKNFIKKYPAKTDWETVEIYFPLKESVEVLKKIIEEVEKNEQKKIQEVKAN